MINLESTSLRIDNWLQNLNFLFVYSSTIQAYMLRHLSIYVKVAQATILYTSCWSPFKDWPLSQWRLIFRWLDKADGIVFICYFLSVFVKFGIERINVFNWSKMISFPSPFSPSSTSKLFFIYSLTIRRKSFLLLYLFHVFGLV